MKIAIPVANEKLCMHFGHCQVFSFFTIDKDKNEIISKEDIVPPPHEPGVLPKWIKEKGASVVLAGGMGKSAQSLFNENGVEVIVGVVDLLPEKAVQAYMEGTLRTGSNICDH